MLRGAKLAFESRPADIDERALTNRLLDEQTPFETIAAQLASEKALAISAQHPDALVIGSDQILEFDGYMLNKAKDDIQAIERLRHMAGQSHRLISGVCVAQGGQVLWQDTDAATLTMHNDLDDQFWAHYAAHAGKALTASVGGYWLEDIGSWLFKTIEGNYFTILGMPLLPLLSYLRSHHHIVSEAL